MNKIECLKCGENNDLEANFCFNCGANLIKNEIKNTSSTKNIKWLNTKWWYRFLKVTYFVFFVLIFALTILIITGDGLNKLDPEKTKINCLLGNKNTYTAEELDLLLPYDLKNGFDYRDFFYGYNEKIIREIFKACSEESISFENEDIYIVQAITEVKHKGFESHEEQIEALRPIYNNINKYYSNTDKANQLSFDTKIFDIVPVVSYEKIIINSIFAGIMILTFFEILRRIFYYIFLNSLFPKN